MFCMHNPSVAAKVINLSKYPAKVMSCRPISDNGGFKASVKFLVPSVYPFDKTLHLFSKERNYFLIYKFSFFFNNWALKIGN